MLLSPNRIRPSTAQDLSGMCILVLDDDPNMRSLISGALLSCRCRDVLRSGVARDALRLFVSHKIDLVICDWAMEPMSGQEMTRDMSGNTQLIFHHHDEVHRGVTALVQAMRLVLQNEIQGDGDQVGARLLEKLRSYTEKARASLNAAPEAR